MKLQGTREVKAKSDEVWATVADAGALAQAMGLQATVETGSGGVSTASLAVPTALGQTKAEVELRQTDRVDGEHVEYEGTGTIGNGAAVRFAISLDVAATGKDSSLTWDADVKIFGVLGSLAQRVAPAILNALFETASVSIEAGKSAPSAAAQDGPPEDEFHEVSLTVNGAPQKGMVPARRLLIHFLRDDLNFTGPHIGCDTGNCGACTIIVDGLLTKSCMLLAVQADGSAVETVEGMENEDGTLNRLQEAFSEHHALQCGYCTPGILASAQFLLERNPTPTEHEIRRALKGNICRCTGYINIIKAIQAVAEEGGVR